MARPPSIQRAQPHELVGAAENQNTLPTNQAMTPPRLSTQNFMADGSEQQNNSSPRI